MGWDAKFQGVWHTGPNIGAGTARLPFYGFGFGTINGQIP
jgi:hypothetical protein